MNKNHPNKYFNLRNGFILSAIIIAINIIFLIIGSGDENLKILFGDIYAPLINLITTIILFYAARMSYLHHRESYRGWALIAIGQLMFLLGDLIWGIFELGLGLEPFSSIADIFYLAYYPLFAMGIFLLPKNPFSQIRQFKTILDISIIILTSALIFWIFLISPNLFNNSTDILSLVISITYVILDFVLLFALIILLFEKLGTSSKKPFIFLAAGIGVQIISDAIYSYQVAELSYISGGFLDIGWILGFVLIALAGIAHVENIKLKKYSQPIISEFTPIESPWLSYLPLFWIFIAYLLLASSHDLFHVNFYRILGFGSIILFLAIIRQILSLRENRELYSDAKKEIATRKKIEKALKQSESHYKSIFENTGTATLIIEDDNTISMVNSEFEMLSGFKKEEIEGKMSWTQFIAKDDLERMKTYHKLRRTEPDVVPRNYEFKFIDRKKNMKNIFLTVSIIPDTKKSLVSLMDITTRKESEKKLKSSLKEKEMLLREIHHRVKNNLQIISSLLSLQSRYVKDENDLEIFKESQNRVKSISYIHEYLYQSRKMSKINVLDYIRRVTTDLIYAYNLDPERVHIRIEIEKIDLNIETATPLGLIVTELVSNSIKHAFPHNQKGEIIVSLSCDNDEFLLTVSDNGVGIPEDFDIEKTETLGLKLVNTLVKQIDGVVELDKTKGTNFKIKFKELKYIERI